MSGRRPKSAARKRKLGNAGKRALPAANIDPVAADPNSPPAWLAQGWQPQSGEALRQWQALVPEMRRLRMFTIFDVNLFGRYCLMMSLWLLARSDVEREGMTGLAAKGGIEKSKSYMQLVELSKELRAMNPNSAARPTPAAKSVSPIPAAPAPTPISKKNSPRTSTPREFPMSKRRSGAPFVLIRGDSYPHRHMNRRKRDRLLDAGLIRELQPFVYEIIQPRMSRDQLCLARTTKNRKVLPLKGGLVNPR